MRSSPMTDKRKLVLTDDPAIPIEYEKYTQFIIPVAIEVGGNQHLTEEEAATYVGVKLHKARLIDGIGMDGQDAMFPSHDANYVRIDSWQMPNYPEVDGSDSEERLIWVPKGEVRWNLWQIVHHMEPTRALVEDTLGRPMENKEYEEFISNFRGGYAGHGWLGTLNLAYEQLRDALVDAGIKDMEDDE